MKTMITAVAATLFAANVSAVEFYQGLADGNSDLSPQQVSTDDFVGTQPGVGDSIDRYHGWADGNPDLFKSDGRNRTDGGDNPDIYISISGNPDLQF